MEKSRFQRARRALIFWTLFIGIGAVGGAGVPAAGGVFREPGNERKMLWISINSQKSAASGCLF